MTSELQQRGQDEYKYAIAGNRDSWVPACGGMETPFMSRGGRRILYCYNPRQQRHAYVCLDTDAVLDHFDTMN